MKTPIILLVEDDREIRALLAELLEREGFDVDVADGGTAMDKMLAKRIPDLIVLDLMLPGEDGLSICRRLRARGGIAILILTAKDEDIDRIVGLELGADDYLGKPFNPRELLARVRAILRRTGETGAGPSDDPRRRFAFADFVADIDARSLTTTDGRAVAMTSAEFDLLACFLDRPKRVLSRDQLLDLTRGRMADPFDRTIDVTVSRLRKRLESAVAGSGAMVTTVRNGGYLLSIDVKPAPT